MQVPTVTLEDLQAFQATHFPGPHNPLAPPTSANEYNAYEAEDDLGYYPDGVKRTLTDEQIQIFRHSEIHALLRARQLERDEVEYEARRRGSGVDEGGVSAAQAADEAVFGNRDERINGDTAGLSARASTGRGKSKKRSRTKHRTQDTSSGALDYGEQQEVARKQIRTEAQAPYPGRRIVSYAEE